MKIRKCNLDILSIQKVLFGEEEIFFNAFFFKEESYLVTNAISEKYRKKYKKKNIPTWLQNT